MALNAWLRYDAIERALAVVSPGSRFLEVGAGQGALGARLARRYNYTGCEPDPGSATLARRRIEAAGGRFISGYDTDLPEMDRFAGIGAFEVLEHLEDDENALARWVGRLDSGGWLVLSVPAFQHRFAAWDALAGHFRRYDPDVLRAKLVAAGLTDVSLWVTGFPFGNLLEHGRNLVATLKPKRSSLETRTLESGRWFQPPDGSGILTQAITLPFRYLQRPFNASQLGTGLVARARKL
jgi:SAM-dependent methyltransferase